ncbi:dedicator of cytokinesis, putative [Entamoeba histolytica HM-1:IMSS-B]|uniref:Dedicator of cytokinesis, putative n=1 Tax=Entamoeba histolytica HM-1:IMSS-B TaxID=885319 RepID=M3SDV6_ENTH1|nr:dedicator of cytokinesis, putative [Entamoeba histolytica HM-1:IMSS-B]
MSIKDRRKKPISLKKDKLFSDHTSQQTRSSLAKTTSYQSDRESLPTPSMNPNPNQTLLFYQYDSDGFGELTIQEIREFLQNEKGMYLTDEHIQSIMSNVLMQTDRIKINDFMKFCKYIETDQEYLVNKSSLDNSPVYRHEDSLFQQRDQDKPKYLQNYNDRSFIHDSQTEQDIISESVNLTNKENELNVKDINIIHNEKPHMSKVAIEEVMKGIEMKNLPALQQSVLNMIFNKTTEVQKRKIPFEKVIMENSEDPLRPYGKDLTTEDSANISILIDDNIQQLNPRQTYKNLFDHYDEMYRPIDEKETLCGRREVLLMNPNETTSDVWIIDIPQIETNDCPNEDLFGVFCIYDITMDKKLTENYYLDFSMEKRNNNKDINNKTTFCINWRVDYFKKTEHKIKGVLLIYKYAELDPNASKEGYLKEEKKKKTQIIKNQSKRSNYKQFLGIGVTDLGEILIGNNSTFQSKELPIYREDIERKQEFDTFLKSDNNKSKQLNITWRYSMKKILTKEARYENKNHSIIQKEYLIKDASGYILQNSNPEGKGIRMLEDFTSIENYKNFFMDFTNNVYVTTKELNITSISQKDKKKTKFVITCYFRCTDKDLKDPSNILNAFYSRKKDDKSFVTSFCTTVSIGNKIDFYLDEFKVKLPLNLNDQYHFFFLIQDVTFPEEQKKETTLQYFAYRPLFEQGKLIVNGEYKLPVYTYDGTTGYMTSTDKVRDGVGDKMSYLVVDINIHSTIFAGSTSLYELLDKVCSFNLIEDVEEVLSKVHNIPVIQLMHFFPVIMSNLFGMFNNHRIKTVIERKSEEKKDKTEETESTTTSPQKGSIVQTPRGKFSNGKKLEHDVILTYILKVLAALLKEEKAPHNTYRQRNHILTSYIDYYFTNPIDDNDTEGITEQVPIFMKLTNCLLWYFEKILYQKDTTDQRLVVVDVAVEYCWFFFDVIIKSLTLYLEELGIFDSSNRLEKIRQLGENPIFQQFNSDVIELGTTLAQTIRLRLCLSKQETNGLFYLNADFGLFINDLIRIYSHTIGFEAMDSYINALSRCYDSQTTTLFEPVGDPMNANHIEVESVIPSPEKRSKCWLATQILRVDFISVLNSYEYFYEVNIPLLVKPNLFESVGELRSLLNERHYFASSIETSFIKLLSRSNEISKYALVILLKRIILCDLDVRFENKKERIAEYFMPFVFDFIDNFERITDIWSTKNLKTFETQDLYLCLIWILKNVNREVLKRYISLEVVSKIMNFIELLVSAKEILSFMPGEICKNDSDKKKYRNVNGMYLGIRKQLVNEYIQNFQVAESEKLRLNSMFEENSKEERSIVKQRPKANEKNTQDLLLFGPSPGLGSAEAYTKRNKKLGKIFGNDVQEAPIERDETRDHIIYDDMLLVILDVVDCLFEELFERKDVDEMNKINRFISDKMFVQPPPAQYIKRFFQFIRKLVRTYGDYLFKENLDFSYKLLRGIINYCNYPDPDIRTNATSVFYLFVRTNYEILGSTQCMRIHTVAALATIGTKEGEDNSLIERALNTLEQWARDDFSQEKFHGQKEESMKQKESVDVIDINAFENYRNKVVQRRLKLLEMIDEDQNGGDRKWRTKERVVRQLINLWKEDPVNEVNESAQTLLNKYEKNVKVETTISGLKLKTNNYLRGVLETIRDCVAFTGEHQMKQEEYKQKAKELCKELDEHQKQFEEYIKELKEVGSSISISGDTLKEIINKTKELVEARINIEQEQIEVEKEHENKMKEFENELKKSSESLSKLYNDACDNLATKDDNVMVLLSSQQKLQQTIGKLNAITEMAKRSHNEFLKKENEVMSISSWNVVFKSWNNILPMGIGVLKSATELQDIINGFEKQVLDENEQMDVELSASEEIVKVYAWEVAVSDVTEFVVGTHQIEDIISMAGKLNQRFRSINSSYGIIQEYYGDNYKKEKSFRMFIELGKKILPPPQLRTKLLGQMRLLNKESQKEKEYEDKRKEYALCFNVTVQLLQFQNDEPTTQLIEISQVIKNIENEKIPSYNKYVNQEDIQKIQEYCEKHPKFIILLPSKNEAAQEIQQSGMKDDEQNNKKFGEELKLLRDHVQSFLRDLSDLEILKKSSEKAIDLITERKLEIAQKYIDCPQIHIPWFKMIANEHEKRGNYVEAGIAIVHIIHFIYCTIKDDIHPLNVEYLKEITNDFLDYKQPSFQSSSTTLNTDTLVEEVKHGVQLFKTAHVYSFAIALYNFIIPYFISNKNYAELALAHEEVNTLYNGITEPFIWYYYCVGFYGEKAFEKDHKKQYIYRSSLRLKEFGNEIKEMRKKDLNGIGISPDWKTNIEGIDIDKCTTPFYTVVNVYPFKDGRKQNNFNVNFTGVGVFVSEQTCKTDKKHPGLEDTQKVRTIYKTKHNIPSVLEREEVQSVIQKVMSPIECCIDDVDNKLEDLSTSIEDFKNKDTNIMSLQPKLKGILVAEVNGGIGAICDTFLKQPNIQKYDVDYVLNLYSLLQRTLFTCKRGLTIHKSNMKQEHAGIQSVFDRGYLSTSKIIRDVKADVLEYARSKGVNENDLVQFN